MVTLPRENNCPIGENSPNLFTLAGVVSGLAAFGDDDGDGVRPEFLLSDRSGAIVPAGPFQAAVRTECTNFGDIFFFTIDRRIKNVFSSYVA
jgi:hypothetical protein